MDVSRTSLKHRPELHCRTVHKNDGDTPAHVRAIQGHCSRPVANPEFLKNMIEIPHEWTYVIYHSSSQQSFDNILLNGVIAGGKKAYNHVTSRPRIIKKAKQYLIRQVDSHRYFFTFVTSGLPTPFMKLIWSKHKRRVQNTTHSYRRRSSRMQCKSRWTRSNDLV